MEQFANHIALTGCLIGAPQYSHSNHGKRFFSFFMEVERLSGAVDRLPILASETLLEQISVEETDTVTVTGQIRSFNNRSSVGRRLVISVLAETLSQGNADHANQVTLQGSICRQPIYRRTPLGREICDLMLAVNRPYRRADYLPCILWGKTAQAASDYAVGTVLSLTGRLQSRDYVKLLEGGTEQRTAYEISVISASSVET